jgi:hypothetical protein
MPDKAEGLMSIAGAVILILVALAAGEKFAVALGVLFMVIYGVKKLGKKKK